MIEYRGNKIIGKTYRMEGTEIIGVLKSLVWNDTYRQWQAILELGYKPEKTFMTWERHLLG